MNSSQFGCGESQTPRSRILRPHNTFLTLNSVINHSAQETGRVSGLRKFRNHSAQRGFSLVEVTLTIGVVAFAFVALLGLLPTGLTVFREAMDTTVTSQIVQRITSELQETDYFTLLHEAHLNGPGEDPVASDAPIYGVLPARYFDDQGNEVRPLSGDGTLSSRERLRVLYEAHVRIARDRQLPGLSPAGNEERVGSRNLATAVIQIVKNPSGEAIELDGDTQLIATEKTKLAIQSFPALIARTGSVSNPGLLSLSR